MPTTLTHALVPLVIGRGAVRGRFWPGFALVAIVLGVLPDLDTIGLRLGIPYEHFWGHRGFLHSLPFAVAAAGVATLLTVRRFRDVFPSRWLLGAFYLFVTVSHPLLDAMTDGGLGVALFAPFDNTRYFLPWRPIRVSPIGLRAFLSRWGLSVLLSELLWVWLPASALSLGIWLGRSTWGSYHAGQGPDAG